MVEMLISASREATIVRAIVKTQLDSFSFNKQQETKKNLKDKNDDAWCLKHYQLPRIYDLLR